MPADARAVDDHLGRLDVAAGQMERVDEAGRRDDGRAVLVVVEDGDIGISSRRRCSMMKQSGALMSSRLMPPKVGPR